MAPRKRPKSPAEEGDGGSAGDDSKAGSAGKAEDMSPAALAELQAPEWQAACERASFPALLLLAVGVTAIFCALGLVHTKFDMDQHAVASLAFTFLLIVELYNVELGRPGIPLLRGGKLQLSGRRSPRPQLWLSLPPTATHFAINFLPAALYAALFLHSRRSMRSTYHAAVALAMLLQWTRRCVEVLFVHRYSARLAPLPALQALLLQCGIALNVHYWVNVATPARLGHVFARPAALAVACGIFFVAQAGAVLHSYLLAQLRAGDGGGRGVSVLYHLPPRTALFRFILCPHYACELMAWAAVTLLAGRLALYIQFFALLTLLAGRALQTKAWYLRHFPAAAHALLPMATLLPPLF